MGTQRKVACRIVAWRVPQVWHNRRRQKLIAEDTPQRRSNAHPRSRLAWCDWTILVTNVTADVLTAKEVAVLYGARWQIELLPWALEIAGTDRRTERFLDRDAANILGLVTLS